MKVFTLFVDVIYVVLKSVFGVFFIIMEKTVGKFMNYLMKLHMEGKPGKVLISIMLAAFIILSLTYLILGKAALIGIGMALGIGICIILLIMSTLSTT